MKSIKHTIYWIGLTVFGVLILPDINAQNYGDERRLAMRTARPTARKVNYVDRDVNCIINLPKGCSNKTVQGDTYVQCGRTFYKPYYRGTQLVYKIVVP